MNRAFLYFMEIWKAIKGFESYQVSNLGRVKSLKYGKEKILKNTICNDGYSRVILYNGLIKKIFKVHKLVAEFFLNHKTCGHYLVINHKDFNKSNNNVENLEIVTQRENTNKKHVISSSKYTGVSWKKKINKWSSMIWFNGKSKHLGYFINEYDAHLAYEKELKKINNNFKVEEYLKNKEV